MKPAPPVISMLLFATSHPKRTKHTLFQRDAGYKPKALRSFAHAGELPGPATIRLC